MDWSKLIPILIGMGSGGTATGDPVVMGGGLVSILIGLGLAYAQAQTNKAKKPKKK